MRSLMAPGLEVPGRRAAPQDSDAAVANMPPTQICPSPPTLVRFARSARMKPRPTSASGTPRVTDPTTAVEFPDGQLYVNLRGFDPSGTPVTPEEAVRVLLDSLDVPATRRPQTIEAQLGMYRSLLAGRRMLVLLDNARDAAQVRPLLPGAPTCRVIVTSRNQLTGLVATAAARPLLLDVLTDREGGALRRRP